MTLKQEFSKLPKELVFDMYMRIVFDFKDYDNITRTKMLSEIIEEYNYEDFLLLMCTKRELDFLDYVSKNKLKEKDLVKYKWEIETLNKKCIFSGVTLEIFEEQQDNVKRALKIYKKENYTIYEMVTFLIGFIRANGSMLTVALKGMINSLFNTSDEDFDRLMYNPLFRFYCGFADSANKEYEIVFYLDYFDLLDDLDVARMEYGMGGSLKVDSKDYIDMFYYGFPIAYPKVKKMYDLISNDLFYTNLVEEARVLNDRTLISEFIDDKNTLKIIDEGLDESFCAAMNGHTPKDSIENTLKKEELTVKFDRTPQNDAHLCKKAADQYYKLYFALLEYTNNKHKVNDKVKKIYKQEGLNVYEISPIDEYLWEHKDDIIDSFIKENPYRFSKDELDLVEGFKKSISGIFTIVGFLRDYTEILSEDGKLYMVKGIRANLDEIIPFDRIPEMVKTTLIMYDDKIIFNSFFGTADVDFGADFVEFAFKEKEEAIKYYHL